MAILEQVNLTDAIRPVPASELEARLAKFRQLMDEQNPGWEMAVINHKVTMYYFAGTMQDGALIIRPQDAILWVRRMYDRAVAESKFADIRPMRSFREVAAEYGAAPETVFMETKKLTWDWQQMFRKYIPFQEIASLDHVLTDLRAVKSAYEIEMMERSGKIHETVLDVVAPKLIVPGMSETQLAVAIYNEMLNRGSYGIVRFNLPLGEEVIGIAAFGKSGLERCAFDGPGGTPGTCIALQSIGNAFRKLTPNTLVYLDIPCGFDGYNTDKTVTYYYGDINKDPNKDVILDAQKRCLELEQNVVEMMKPGTPIQDLYTVTMDNFNNIYGDNFMNGGKFLGHSIGLVMDEAPAIARGFKEGIQVGMTFAVEPKIALPGIGLVGTENTYVVTENGARCLTGKSYELRCVE